MGRERALSVSFGTWWSWLGEHFSLRLLLWAQRTIPRVTGAFDSLNQHVAGHPKHLLEGYTAPGVSRIGNDELLTLPMDVLIPAAMEHQIRADNAPYTSAQLTVEAANGPTTREADQFLNERGTIIVPDILANAGGVVVSYLEWVQNLQSFYWEEDEINSRLKSIMTRSFKEVWEFGTEHGVPLRLAATMLAVKRVADAVTTRGVFP